MNQLSKRAINNINRLADFLSSKKYEFAMCDSRATPKCGSAGCIGGHAAVLWPDIRTETFVGWVEDKTGKEFTGESFGWKRLLLQKKLGISENAHEELCYMTGVDGEDVSIGYTNTDEESPDRDGPKFSEITHLDAAKCLRILAETGKVDWVKATEES